MSGNGQSSAAAGCINAIWLLEEQWGKLEQRNFRVGSELIDDRALVGMNRKMALSSGGF